jgi:Ca2+-binding RTX toxin-like protein
MIHAESLERRRLFTAVSQGIPGYYDVQGTDDDDTIEIAVDQEGGTFTLDGATYGGVLHVTVKAGAGNDLVTVSSAGSGSIAAAIHGDVGNDALTLNMNGGVWGEDGNDLITLRNSFRGEAYGGAGDDYISVHGNCIENQLEGNEGNDIIWALDNNYGVVLFGGSGDDRLYGSRFDDVIFDGSGSDWIFGLAGNDEFHTNDGARDWIMGGDGIDTLWCDNVEGGINSCEVVHYGG